MGGLAFSNSLRKKEGEEKETLSIERLNLEFVFYSWQGKGGMRVTLRGEFKDKWNSVEYVYPD